MCGFTVPHLQEAYVRNYGELLRHHGEPPVAVKRVETVEEVLREADVSGGQSKVPDVCGFWWVGGGGWGAQNP
jgi:hypothetical protein